MTTDFSDKTGVSIRTFDLKSDLPVLHEWLGGAWLEDTEFSLENFAKKFSADDGMYRSMIMLNNERIGYIQAYWLSSEPEYARQVGLPHDAVAIDILLHKTINQGKGMGTTALRAFVDAVVFGEMDAAYACMNPHPGNEPAVRSYEKVGFRGNRIAQIEFDDSGEFREERIMVLARDAFRAGDVGYGASSK